MNLLYFILQAESKSPAIVAWDPTLDVSALVKVLLALPDLVLPYAGVFIEILEPALVP